MFLRCLLVPTAPGNDPTRRMDAALRLSRRLHAHIGVGFMAPGPEHVLASMASLVPVGQTTIEAIEQGVREAATDGKAALQAWCGRQGVAFMPTGERLDATFATWTEYSGEVELILTSLGRVNDLVIVDRPDPARPFTGRALDTALFSIGRPTLMIGEPVTYDPLYHVVIESYLVFLAGPDVRAVPLALVTRLETVDAERIEWLGERPLIQYRGHLMPLVAADPDMAVRREGSQDLLVFSDGTQATGLLVDGIVDIVAEHARIETGFDRPGIIGSAVLRGRATDIVDVAHHLNLTGTGWGQGTQAGEGRRTTILLVEDSPIVREILVATLNVEGYAVSAVADTDGAMAALSGTCLIDAVVGSIATLADLRAKGCISGMPAVALAAVADSRTIARANGIGLTDLVARSDRRGLLAALAALPLAGLPLAA